MSQVACHSLPPPSRTTTLSVHQEWVPASQNIGVSLQNTIHELSWIWELLSNQLLCELSLHHTKGCSRLLSRSLLRARTASLDYQQQPSRANMMACRFKVTAVAAHMPRTAITRGYQSEICAFLAMLVSSMLMALQQA